MRTKTRNWKCSYGKATQIIDLLTLQKCVEEVQPKISGVFPEIICEHIVL